MTPAEFFGLLGLAAALIGIVFRRTTAGVWIVIVSFTLLFIWAVMYGDEVLGNLLRRHHVVS